MMLTPRLTNCLECDSIPALLVEIDCKIKDLSLDLYNNTVFMLNKPVPGNAMLSLLNYKRILTYKFCNPDYASQFTISMIASKIKVLKYKK